MESFRAGCDMCEITTENPAVTVGDPLYARTVVLDDGETKIAVIAMDCIAIGDIGEVGDGFFPSLRAKLASEYGFSPENILVSATHTHVPGPMVCGDGTRLDRMAASVGRALKKLEPARLGSGIGYDNSFIINRTLKMKDGSAWTVRQAHPCPPDSEIAGLDDADAQIGVIRIDRDDGSALAVLFCFGCHPLTGLPDNSVSAQFPGFAAKTIEENLGGGVMALFLQGTGGDVTEVFYKEVNRPKNCTQAGISLGLSVLKTARQIKTEKVKIKVCSVPVEFLRRFDGPEVIEKLLEERERLLARLPGTSLNFKTFLPLYIKYLTGGEFPLDYAYAYMHEERIGRHDLKDQDKINRANIEKYLDSVRVMEKLAKIQDAVATLRWHKKHNDDSGVPTAKADILGIRLGGCVLISAPVEALTEIGARVKKMSPFEKTFVAAFSNGYMHYGAPAHAYNNGGYETIECMLAEGWQEIYEKAVSEILSRLHD